MRLPRLRMRRGETPLGAPLPIGLELRPGHLGVVQFEMTGGGPYVRAGVSLEIPELGPELLRSPRELGALLRDRISGQGFSGRRAVSAMPGHIVKLVLLGYEHDGGPDEDAAIVECVAERTAEPVGELVIDYLRVREEAGQGKQRSALVAIAREEDVVAYLEGLRAARLEVEALEIAPVAVRRLVTWPPTHYSGDNVIVLHCNRENSHLTVLWGRRLILYSDVDFVLELALARLTEVLDLPGGSAGAMVERYGLAGPGDDASPDAAIRRAIAEVLKPALQPVVDEVSRAVRYTESRIHGERVDEVLVSGELARWPGVDRILASLLPVPVSVIDPLARLRGSRGFDTGPGLEVAAGLALRGVPRA